ncbi:hypothetical protein ACFX2I_011584 [Malus domestica]
MELIKLIEPSLVSTGVVNQPLHILGRSGKIETMMKWGVRHSSLGHLQVSDRGARAEPRLRCTNRTASRRTSRAAQAKMPDLRAQVCASRVRLVHGTERDGTGRGVPSRVWCAKNGWNGLFHGIDFGSHSTAAVKSLMDHLQTTHDSAVTFKCLIAVHQVIKYGSFILEDQLVVYPVACGRNYLNLSNFRDDSTPIAWELSS